MKACLGRLLIFHNRAVKILFKAYAEILAVLVADGFRDLINLHIGRDRQLAGFFHSGLYQVIVQVDAEGFLKKAGQIAVVDIKVTGDPGQGKVLLSIILFQIILYLI